MRKFILNSIVFILPILLVVCIMEYSIRSIPNDYKAKKEYLDKNAQSIKTLALGHSQILNGFNPELMSMDSYNFAFSGQSIKYDYKILDKYIDKLVSLEYVVIPISYLSLFHKLEDSPLSNYVKNYRIYLEIDTDSESLFVNRYEILNYKFKTNFNRLRSYFLSNKSGLTFGKYGWKEKEIGPKLDLIKTGQNEAKVSFKRLNVDNKEVFENENITYLKAIFEMCKKRNIHIILISPPTYHSYRSNIDLSYFKHSQKVVKQLIDEYGNSTYLNLFDHVDFIGNDYRDANHLNKKGSKKMTTIIDNYIKKHKSS